MSMAEMLPIDPTPSSNQALNFRSVVLKLSALGVRMPLQRCESDCATICDAEGRDVFTVDANGNRPDEEAEQIAVILMDALNNSRAMGVL